MKTCLTQRLIQALLFFAPLLANAASPPVVSNVRASQRSGTKLVDVYYDVSDVDGGTQLIQMQVSADAGVTYTIPCVTLSGDAGSGVVLGTNKHIVWNAGVDWNGQFVASTKVRVTASDGTFPAPPPGMAYIPAGSFQMGDNLDGMTDALPVHNVQVDGFFMDKFEAKKELWLDVQTWALGHGYTGLPSGNYYANGHPVQSISWYSTVKWCNARSEKEGLTPCYYTDTAQTLVYRSGNVDVSNAMVNWAANGYRLPTEAEWEKAARGGALGFRYPWGNTITGSQANYSGSGDPFEVNNPATTPVGYYNGSQVPAGVDMANGYGLYDMAGNLFEWCWDWFGATFYSDSLAGVNPRGPLTGSHKIVRGASWNTDNGSQYIRLSNRRYAHLIPGWGYSNAGFEPGNSVITVGFRCVRGL